MSLSKDLRFAFRQHSKSLGFTLVILATLGLCIGANSAIFSVLDSVLFRPAPYPQPDRLAMVVTAHREQGGEEIDHSQTGALFEAVREGAPGLDVAAWSGDKPTNFLAGDHPESILQQRVSTGFFRVLGVEPQYGREFSRAEDIPGGAAVVVLSHRFWQRVFAATAARSAPPSGSRARLTRSSESCRAISTPPRRPTSGPRCGHREAAREAGRITA